MPIWLRKFTYKKINEHFNRMNEAKAGKSSFLENTEKFKASGEASDSQPQIKTPHFVKSRSDIKTKPSIRYSPKN